MTQRKRGEHLGLYVEDGFLAELDKLAEEHDVTRSVLVRRVLRAFMRGEAVRSLEVHVPSIEAVG